MRPDPNVTLSTISRLYQEEHNEYPYEVTHPDGEVSPPKFRTWREALDAARKWNTDVPGHRARKRTKA